MSEVEVNALAVTERGLTALLQLATDGRALAQAAGELLWTLRHARVEFGDKARSTEYEQHARAVERLVERIQG